MQADSKLSENKDRPSIGSTAMSLAMSTNARLQCSALSVESMSSKAT